MLASQEKVVMFVQERTMQSNQGLPLLIVQLRTSFSVRCLRVINLDAFALNHNKTGVDALDFGNKLLLGDGSCFGLLQQLRSGWVIIEWR